MNLDYKILLNIRTIDQLIEIMKINKELQQDTILKTMEKLDPSLLDL
jgi:hypothetical protein